VERRNFNQTVQGFNTLIRKFPQSIIANISGFEKKGYFEAKEGADEAPEVNFN